MWRYIGVRKKREREKDNRYEKNYIRKNEGGEEIGGGDIIRNRKRERDGMKEMET